MKIEEGKKYVDRRGRVFGPMVKSDRFFGEGPDSRMWNINGKVDAAMDWDMDLIAERVEVCQMCDNPCAAGQAACDECLKPVESPDDWVTQDRVPARPGIDQRAYSHGTKTELSEESWDDAGLIRWPKMPMHGHNSNGTIVHLRCRRKDLPQIPQQSKKTPITLWVPERGVQEGGDWPVRACFRDAPPNGIGSWVKISFDGEGFFVEGEA